MTPEPRPPFLSQNKLLSFGTEGQTRSPAHLSGTGSLSQPSCYPHWEGWTPSLTENSNTCCVCSRPPQKVTLQAELKGRLAQTRRVKTTNDRKCINRHTPKSFPARAEGLSDPPGATAAGGADSTPPQYPVPPHLSEQISQGCAPGSAPLPCPKPARSLQNAFLCNFHRGIAGKDKPDTP